MGESKVDRASPPAVSMNHAGTRTHAHAHTHSEAEIEEAAFGTKGARGKGGRRTEEEFSPCLCP